MNVIASSPIASALARIALNPQPLPPKAQTLADSGFDRVALNPQPLPPKSQSLWGSALDKIALNPQPLPPGIRSQFADIDDCGTKPHPHFGWPPHHISFPNSAVLQGSAVQLF